MVTTDAPLPTRIWLTGGPAGGLGAVAIEDLNLGPLGRVAFAYLASQGGRAVPRDELADALWGERVPPSWDASLRGLISRLRRALAGAGLGVGALATVSGSYRLRLPEGTVFDLDAAKAAVESAPAALAGGDPRRAAEAAGAALEVAVRPFLPGAEGAWVERRREELGRLRVRALEALAEAALAAGDHADAVRAAEEAIALEPFRESAHLRVMAAHDAAGSRGEALRAYERCRRLLADELGVQPSPATEAAYLALLGAEPEPEGDAALGDGARPTPPTNLPPELSTFVGRAVEVAEAARLLSESRLVTLTGPGGVGKTRLALRAAAEVVAAHPAGTFLVELDAVGDGALVGAQVLVALGLGEPAGADPVRTVAAHVGQREVLVVLDNCEHVVDAAAGVVVSLLRACPGLRVLATSREPLRVPGEVVRAVAPLDLPEPGTPGALAADSVRLFAERARAAEASFDPAGDAAAVVRICRRLDGLPLALELAAARVGALAPADIADLLDDRFRLLTAGARTAPPRHQTLQAAIEWSYEALAEPERRLFDRLSVFPGGFTLDAAEQVGAGDGVEPGDVLELLSTLVTKSLVVAERRRDRIRYRLLETLRHYGRDALEASGRAPSVRARHLAWAVDVAEEADRELGGAGQAAWLSRMDDDQDNLRAALAWAVAGPARPAALRLAAALGRFWELRGHLSEGRHWLSLVLAPAAHGSRAERARALNAAAVLAQRQGSYAEAGPLYHGALALHWEAGDRLGAAAAMLGLGNVAAVTGDLGRARELFEQCRTIGAEVGSPAAAAAALTNLGWIEATRGNKAAARHHYEEALAAQEASGDTAGLALTLAGLGRLALARGDSADARARYERSLALRQALGDRAGVADSLAGLGDVALHDGDLDGARSLHEHGLALRRELGDGSGLPDSLRSLADVATSAGDPVGARSRLEESLAVAEASGDRHCAVLALVRLARLARLDGDHDGADRLSREAVAGPDPSVTKASVAEWLEGLAAAAGGRHRLDEAARLLGAAAGLRAAIGIPVTPGERAGVEHHVAGVRAALGEDRFHREWARGERMGVEEAVLYASSRRT